MHSAAVGLYIGASACRKHLIMWYLGFGIVFMGCIYGQLQSVCESGTVAFCVIWNLHNTV